ncbi:WxL domain-containing protein [Enterococcus faecalis]|uniref:WxL domain-containing protein n=1 Tax=Enterococcus faecalis TaxID=1351 RepID=UPI001A0825CF|nr:WxL domain-containing protein [Enterococcus faecalis]EGO8404093.1 WxL domain-containing protein [Enterococcus faecalis]EGO8898141.1 WxL domain-containing protein [Enterococcus faecalis]EGO9036431.1 WxL domain-containing protein [Enterococcus faecalis]EGO9188894.1 WxL domain-containing protein [Enterococcus faecalis]EIP8061583.1 WxL domain-containing protein [Enterococcus faecalis]
MKKKMMASLLIRGAVVVANLAPLSAQAVTTGNTPVTATFEGGTLPDGNGDANTVDPDQNGSNSNFDLLYIPREFDFGKLSISDDLTQPILNKEDESGDSAYAEKIGIGDMRGTKEGWHVTAQSNGLNQGSETLQGSIAFGTLRGYVLKYDETSNRYIREVAINNPEISPEIPINKDLKVVLGGDAQVIANASSGKGQGLWEFTLFDTSLNITTPYQQIKAGAYTGSVTWNLVAGPSI